MVRSAVAAPNCNGEEEEQTIRFAVAFGGATCGAGMTVAKLEETTEEILKWKHPAAMVRLTNAKLF